ncbi:MAG TPA: serine/threonine-protein kinase [Verrucomicrobiae bacterium]|nr:serine/threonine-protein kinase [Verrucomicrobiae bacterium]
MTHLREIEKALFDAARNVTDPAARQALLDQTCNGNPALRTRIETLLTVQEPAEEFFTVHELKAEAAETSRAEATAPDDLTDNSAAEPGASEGPNARIGHYRLLQRMGEGGCGVVYLAEQEEPLRRRVALKIIRLGMDTENVIARFEAERQALALMDHPNIAHVLDAGATNLGRPYFVMELVRGVKITDYCNQHHLDLRQRLDLFIQVCHAIQHAHQKGVIHRDIKPSNILVSLHDGVAVPKVIDFGIAKATAGRLADNPAVTAYGQFIGTPAYMSPEQAELGGVDVDTRSDIYSLGALLYELLTGRTPFDNKQLLDSGWDEMRRMLQEKEPLRPSNIVATFPPAELRAIAGKRGLEPARMISLLKGDLDWIVMKAMEKDRSRRYETANGLAMDMTRYLNNEPVMARPPSRRYRLQKLVRRNRAVFVSIAAVAATLILGLGASTWLLFREREARHEAERGRASEALLRQQAEARAAISQAAALVGENQFGAADQLMAKVTFPENGLGGEAVFRPLGDWAAVQGRWQRAAEYFKLLVRVDQMETPDVATLDSTRCAVALIEAGDTPGYERFRREIIERFASTRYPVEAERTVKNSLLLPVDSTIMAALAPLADLAAKAVPTGTPTPLEEPWPGAIAWRCDSLALWSYRRADYAAAVGWCQRCLSYGNDNAARVATANAILAMSCSQLGQVQNARNALALSRNLVDSNSGQGNGGQGYWFDWRLDQILMNEAATLVEQPRPNPTTGNLPSPK